MKLRAPRHIDGRSAQGEDALLAQLIANGGLRERCWLVGRTSSSYRLKRECFPSSAQAVRVWRQGVVNLRMTIDGRQG